MQTANRTSPWHALLRETPSRGSLTWASATGVFALYWIYSLLISPLVAPPELTGPERSTGAGWVGTGPLTNVELAKKHLPHVPWARNPKYQLRTASAIVYAEEWEPVDSDKAVRAKPFAMIWMPQGHKPGDTPVTVVSDSAYVRFTNKFDISKPNPGRVIGGSLEGNVEIRGENGLHIVGKNFVFSEKAMRMWSDAPLTFAYGPHRGSAHGLQCGLLPTKEPPTGDKLAVGGIETVRLRKNVVMDLVLEKRKAESGKRKATRSATLSPPSAFRPPPSPAEKPTLVNVRSDGAFEFGVQTNVGVFEENVRVTRPTKPGLRDILLCDVLTLVFVPDETKQRAKAKPPKKPAGEKFQTLNSHLTFRRMRAQSRDPRRRVVLISEANRLKAWMDDLIHDAELKVTELRDHDRVHVLQEATELHAPKIALLQDQKGDTTRLWCEGAGSMRHFDKQTRKIDFTAVWKKRLRKFPDPKSNLDVIDLEHDVVLDQPAAKSDLRAQFVRIWLDRREKTNPTRKRGSRESLAGASGSNAVQPRPPDAGDGDDPAKRTRLRRMLALEQVTMTSAEMRSHTKRLEVWFEHADEQRSESPPSQATAYVLPTRLRRASVPYAASVGPFSRDSKSSERSAGAGPALRAPLRKASESRLNRASRLNGGRRKDDGPMDVWADLIRVRVEIGAKVGPKDAAITEEPGAALPSGGRSKVREVWTLGNVKVEQQHGPGEKPLRITGDRMHLVNRSEEDQVVHVYGKPGHVYDRLTHIQGDRIHLDRGRNVSWVDGKGLLELPVDRMLDGRKLAKPQPLYVQWRKSMDFDGRTARFRGNVRSDIEDSSIRCEEMDVYLTERVSFIKRTGKAEGGRRKAEGGGRIVNPQSAIRNPQSAIDSTHQPAKVKTVTCRGNVQIESYEYEPGQHGRDKLMQIRKGIVKSFEIDQITGNSKSDGPGTIEIWRLGQGQSTPFGQPAVRPNQAAKKSKPPGWNYTKIEFAEGTTGNLKQRFNRFRTHVKVVHGPVQRPPHVVDADHIPKGGGAMRCRELVVTQMPASGVQRPYFTMEADGNAVVEGDSYHGRADKITYDESKGLYILRSLGRENATIWRQLKVGGEREPNVAKRMEFEPATNRLKLDQASQLQGLR